MRRFGEDPSRRLIDAVEEVTDWQAVLVLGADGERCSAHLLPPLRRTLHRAGLCGAFTLTQSRS
jgi:hypothetical protein